MFTIIGVRNVRFDKDGKVYYGYTVYYTYVNGATEGLACDKIYISDAVCNLSNFKPVVGAVLREFSYNRYGKLQRVVFDDCD